MAATKESMQKPSRSFKMPYAISAVAFQGKSDNFQALALGLVDGAVVVIDLVLGVEKFFLEKHPAEVTSLAFFEDKSLISGSVDGRVNLTDLEVDPETDSRKILKCQNCQDRRIPVAKVIASDFGIGAAVDIEGNCRFYDLIRLRKMAKVSSLNQRESEAKFASNPCRWKLLPQVAFEVTGESFLAVTQTPELSGPEDAISEKKILVDRKYCDVRENLKSAAQILYESPEVPFYHQKSTLCIFRFEDVIFNLYPQMAQVRKKGMPSIKETFIKQDPTGAAVASNQAISNMMMQSGGDRLKNDMSSSKSNTGVDFQSLCKVSNASYPPFREELRSKQDKHAPPSWLQRRAETVRRAHIEAAEPRPLQPNRKAAERGARPDFLEHAAPEGALQLPRAAGAADPEARRGGDPRAGGQARRGAGGPSQKAEEGRTVRA